MRQIAVVIAILIVTVVPASAFTIDELTPYISGQHLTWEESDQGARLLKETGWLFGAGEILDLSHSSLALRAKAELFGGVVDYQGQTIGPAPIPVSTDVTYLGGKAEVDVGGKVPLPEGTVEPFVGIGYRLWLRDLQNSSSGGQSVAGYTEHWDEGYARFGARGIYHLSSSARLFLEGGAKYPFYVANWVDFADVGKVTFHPDGKVSGFAEAGVTVHRLQVALTYEGSRYSRSPLVAVQGSTAGNGGMFFQPDSKSDLVGLRVGYTFH